MQEVPDEGLKLWGGYCFALPTIEWSRILNLGLSDSIAVEMLSLSPPHTFSPDPRAVVFKMLSMEP